MSSSISLWVASPDTRSERRFDLHTTVADLKAKLELFTGIPPANQRIALYEDGEASSSIAVLDDDARPLGFYSPRHLQWLKVEDTNPSTTWTGQLNDTSGVEKFELTEEQYATRQDSVLAYKQRHKVGRFAPKDDPPASHQAPNLNLNIPLGSRCQIESSEPGLSKRGTVRFVGPTKFGNAGVGIWVGVEYDEPIGRNDGSVEGVRYFECRDRYGGFVRPEKVEVGDFPVEEIDFDDEEI